MRFFVPIIPGLLRAAAAAVALATTLPALAAHNISWMYEADVPVLNQSQQARVQAAETGFRQVLGRLTGQGEIGLTIRVSGASADRLMTRFSYHSVMVDGHRQPRVKLSFNPGQTLATVRNAGLPVWGATRPAVKLYLLSQEADGARIPLAENHPVRQAMVQQAWVRGLVLTFPAFNTTEVPIDAMLDAVNPNRVVEPLAEAATGEPGAVPGETLPSDGIDASSGLTDSDALSPCVPGTGVAAVVEAPPEPFLPGIIPRENELVLVGEFRTLPPAAAVVAPQAAVQVIPGQPAAPAPGPAFRWASGTDRGVVDLPVGDAIAQGRQLVDQIADVLGRRFAVPWVNPLARTLRIAAVTRIPDYAELMRYLGRQEIFARVDLLEAGPEHFLFSVVTPADEAALERVFQVEARLRPEQPAVPEGVAAAQTESAAGTDPSCDPAEATLETTPVGQGTIAEEGTVDNGPPVFVWQN